MMSFAIALLLLGILLYESGSNDIAAPRDSVYIHAHVMGCKNLISLQLKSDCSSKRRCLNCENNELHREKRGASQFILRTPLLYSMLRGGAPETQAPVSDSIDDELARAMALLEKVVPVNHLILRPFMRLRYISSFNISHFQVMNCKVPNFEGDQAQPRFTSSPSNLVFSSSRARRQARAGFDAAGAAGAARRSGVDGLRRTLLDSAGRLAAHDPAAMRAVRRAADLAAASTPHLRTAATSESLQPPPGRDAGATASAPSPGSRLAGTGPPPSAGDWSDSESVEDWDRALAKEKARFRSLLPLCQSQGRGGRHAGIQS
jgi:hypothetical protein